MARTLREDQYRNNHAAGIAQMQLSASGNLFGQITLKEVQYGTEKNPDWVHISYVNEETNRNRCLKASRTNGKTTYKVI